MKSYIHNKNIFMLLTLTALLIITSNSFATMVLIPSGTFQIGDVFSEGSIDELPVHEVYLDTYYIDAYEVTNAEYKKFMDATGRSEPTYWNDSRLNAPDHPVVGITWDDAMAYAEWAGKRLPTEAEWEKAARGGLIGMRFPWGDTLTRNDANYVYTGGIDIWERTSPVGSFAPNNYGLYDMAGNVWEWCSDWYGVYYYSSSPTQNPMGPSSGSDRVIRGGSNLNDFYYLRVACRFMYGPEYTHQSVGFRCASSTLVEQIIPEPSTILLLSTGIGGITTYGLIRRRKV